MEPVRETLASADYEDSAELKEKVAVLDESVVEAFVVAQKAVTVALRNDSQWWLLSVEHHAANDPETGGVADWELFMPQHLYIEFRPGGVWSCLRSDEPIEGEAELR